MVGAFQAALSLEEPAVWAAGNTNMFETRFGLSRRPFPATPDAACYYPATGHERVLSQLRAALEEGQGFAVLTGEPGTGKTLLAQLLLERRNSNMVGGFVHNTHFADRAALLQAILFDFSLPYENANEQGLRLRLTEFLLAICRNGQQAVVVIDEAHHLSEDQLEELRLLANLETGEVKALSVILVGQLNLMETLKLPKLEAFRQRLVTRLLLAPLGVDEAADYLLHHLRRAGARPESLISDEALEILARHTRGVPRLLNQAARQALILANDAEAAYVDVEAALEALTALGIEVPDDSPPATIGPIGGEDEPEEGISGSYRLFDAPRRVL
jgi:type II secretory pathway predicted ATPase ExeA